MGLMNVLVLFMAILFTANGQGRGTVRLVRNGVTSTSYSAGIVEIYYSTSSFSSNRWGNICDDSSFASTEATVTCRQLGYTGASTYGKAGSTSSYGTDNSITLLDDVNCYNSNYLTLQQCSVTTSISSTCSLDSQDAYVVCYTTRIWNSPYSGQIRLQGGSYSSYGRLEVYCNGEWGTVCDDGFGSTDARVACRQLGYSDSYTYSGNLAGSSSQSIWLTYVSCSSSYNCLSTCQSCPSSSVSSCSHSEDVALGCEFDSLYTTSSNTLDTCRYADTSVNVGAIVGGVIAAFVICMLIIIAIPICICCCLGIGIGASVRGSNRTARTTVVSGAATSGVAAMTTSSNTMSPPAYNPQAPPSFSASGYDAEKAGYPPQQGYAPQQGYPPQQDYYPPQQGYPPQQDYYPPQQGYPAYPPQ